MKLFTKLIEYSTGISLKLKKLQRIRRTHRLSKRQEFVIATLIMTCGLIVTQLVSVEMRSIAVISVSIIAFCISALVLRDDLNGVEWLTLLTLPTLFTTSVSVFYYLLPVRWLTRIPIAFLYMIGFYAILLTENIYNVAANRTIALLRAAHTVGFLLTLFTYFSISHSIVSLYSFPIIHTLSVGALSFVLALQILWSIRLERKVEGIILQLSIFCTLISVQTAWISSFLPVNKTLQSLLLTVVFYISTALSQQYLMEKMYKKTVYEFIIVLVIMIILVGFGTHWR